MFNQKITWLEASNIDLRRELDEAQVRIVSLQRCATESQVSRDFPCEPGRLHAICLE